jgi:hypothetical protein
MEGEGREGEGMEAETEALMSVVEGSCRPR